MPRREWAVGGGCTRECSPSRIQSEDSEEQKKTMEEGFGQGSGDGTAAVAEMLELRDGGF